MWQRHTVENFKAAWRSNVGQLSGNRASIQVFFSLLETVLQMSLTVLFFHHQQKPRTSLSNLKRVKTWLRSTMPGEHLCGMMSVHRKKSANKQGYLERAIDRFARDPNVCSSCF